MEANINTSEESYLADFRNIKLELPLVFGGQEMDREYVFQRRKDRVETSGFCKELLKDLILVDGQSTYVSESLQY